MSNFATSLNQHIIAERFQLESIAGRGGMGTVYRTRDLQTGKLVALKLLNTAAAIPQELDRFNREAEMLAQMRHPNIVEYIGHGCTPEGAPFLVMEWLDGEDLAALLHRNGSLGIQDSLTVVRKAAEALSLLHTRGIIHRDIKPSNLFLKGHLLESLTLLDFGIARTMSNSLNMTHTGAVIGTLDYMAPDQARGEKNLGPSVDVFSLGCVLYECLTGRPPFLSETVMGLLAKLLFEEAQPVGLLRSEVPPELEELIARMLHKDKSQRPRDAAVLIEELDLLRTQFDVSAAEWPGNRPRSWRPRNLTQLEQQLVSVIIARSPDEEQTVGPTLLPSDPESELYLRRREALSVLGAKVEFLPDGTLMATLEPTGSAMDQVVQAARCALVLQESWLHARIALATGRAVMDKALPTGEAIDRAVSLLAPASMKPSTAESVQSARRVDGISIDEISASLLDSRFITVRDESGIFLRAERLSVDENRLLLGQPTPCVGREQELAMLEAMLAGCIDASEPRVMLVTGSPGMGKSRLRQEFRRRIERHEDPLTILYGRGESLSAGSPYGVLGPALLRLCEVQPSDGLELQQSKLKQRLGQHLSSTEVVRIVPFLGEVCGVRFPDDNNTLLRSGRQDPKIMGEQIKEAFITWLRRECDHAPVLLILEDMHWGDHLTVKLIDNILRDLRSQPLMVVALARPEIHDKFPKLWATRGQQEIRLGGLARRAVERFIQQVMGGRISKDKVDRIIQYADGNPLYLEELIRASGQDTGDFQPLTVVAMIQARLNALSATARRLLRIASVFGETFWYSGVMQLLGGERHSEDLNSLLEQLIAEELIERHAESRLPEQAEYGFRHALIWDAVYRLLTDADKELGHRLACSFLEQNGESDAMILAEHAHRGGDAERAVPLFIRAAAQSLDRYDLDGVVLRAQRGVDLGAQGTELGTLRALQFRARFYLGDMATIYPIGMEAITLLTKGSAWWCKSITHLFVIASHQSSPDALQSLVGLFSTAEPSPDAAAPYVEACSWLVIMFTSLGLRGPATSFLEPMLRVGTAVADAEPIVRGFMLSGHCWYVRMLMPEPALAVKLARQQIQAFEEAGNRNDVILGHLALGLALLDIGEPDAGEQEFRTALVRSSQVGGSFMTNNVKAYLALFLVQRGRDSDLREATLIANELLSIQISPIYAGLARLVLAQTQLISGQLEDAEREALQAFSLLQMMRPFAILVETIHSRILVRQGRAVAGLEMANRAYEFIEKVNDLGWNGVTIRAVVAEARAASGDRQGAELMLREARDQIRVRAENIPDPAVRQGFLANVPLNKQVLEQVAALPA